MRKLGCVVLATALIFSCACSRRTSKTRTSRETNEPKETTEETTDDTTDETTDDTTDETTDETTDDTTADTTDDTTADDTTKDTTPSSTAAPSGESAKILHDLDEKLFKESFSDIIDLEFTLDHPENLGIEWPEQGLECWSEEDDEKDKKEVEEIEKELAKINVDDLSLEDKMLYETIKADIEFSKRGEKFEYMTATLNSLTGVQTELPLLFATLQIEDVESAERYIKMLRDTYPYFESLLKYEQKRAELGNSLPDKYLENIADSCVAVYKDHDGNYLFTTFDEKINALDIDQAEKTRLIDENKKALEEAFFPAYQMLEKGIKDLYGTAKTQGHLCELKDGKEFYEYYFQLRSGTSLTVEEAIKILEDKIDSTTKEMTQLVFKMTPQEQQQIMSNQSDEYTTGSFEKDIEFCKDKIKTDFPALPDHEYYTFHVPKEMSENFSPAAYMTTQLDNLKKNQLLLNDNSTGLGDMIPTVAHEAYPGHLYEAVYHIAHLNNYYQKTGGSTAYKEGWSTYCENYIMGLTDYSQNIYRYFKLNKDLVNYYIHARVDIGIHYEDWSYDDVVKYLTPLFGGQASEAAEFFYDMDVEIPCYITPYCFGNMNCTQIINDAIKNNPDVSVDKIHAAYLNMGPSNFDLLSKYMQLYVDEQK